MADLIYPAKSFDVYGGQQTDAELKEMWDDGYRVVIHYLSWTAGKNLTRASAVQLTQAGFWVGAVWEAAGASQNGFSGAMGVKDATEAVRQAKLIGIPDGTAIAFAVDFDPNLYQINNYVLPYFGSAATVLHPAGYQVGVYACGNVLLATFHAGTCNIDWLAGAMGWSGSRGYVSPYDPSGKPAMTQGLEHAVEGLDIDEDMVYRPGFVFQVAA